MCSRTCSESEPAIVDAARPCRCSDSDEISPVTLAVHDETSPRDDDIGEEAIAWPSEAPEFPVEDRAAADLKSADGAPADEETLPQQNSLDLLQSDSFDRHPALEAPTADGPFDAEFPAEPSSEDDGEDPVARTDRSSVIEVAAPDVPGIPESFRVEWDRASASADDRLDAPIAALTPTRALGPRELMTGLIGVVGGAFLIFALLSARGAAAPDSNASSARPSAPAGIESRSDGRPTGAATPAVPPASRQRDARPTWTSNPAAWVGTDRHSAAFEVAAMDKVQVWMRQVRPILVVRCRANAIEAFVFTDSPAKMEPQDGNHTVRIRFDEQPEVTERWPDSAEHDALFAPDGGGLVRRLIGANTMTFAFSPHNSRPVATSFEVGGLAGHLAAAVKQCGWKPKAGGM